MVMDTPPRGAPRTHPKSADQEIGKSWRDLGSCLDHDPDLWFSDLPAYRRAAVDICFADCPVRQECQSWADRTNQRFGIWGGLDYEVKDAGRDGAWLRGERGKDHAALSILDRVAACEAEYPGAYLSEVADRLGYKDGGSLERTLYRKGEAGRQAIRRLKPGSRNREDVEMTSIPTPGHGLAVDCEHPWFTQAALPVNAAKSNVQFAKKIPEQIRSRAK